IIVLLTAIIGSLSLMQYLGYLLQKLDSFHMHFVGSKVHIAVRRSLHKTERLRD
ncbi:hypothetical protein JTE90_006329, partial [Oedothorax gibbosus]